jgi:hypothetical protein
MRNTYQTKAPLRRDFSHGCYLDGDERALPGATASLQNAAAAPSVPPASTNASHLYSIDEKVADGISGRTRKGPNVSSLGLSRVSTFGPLEPESSQRSVSR